MGFVHLWELWLTYNITRSEKDKFDLHVYFSLTSIMRNLKTCPPSSCHKFIFCPHAIIPPCNYICQIYQRKKKKKRERETKKENYCLLLVSFVRCEIKVSVTQPRTYCFFFLWLLSLSPTVYCLRKVTIKF